MSMDSRELYQHLMEIKSLLNESLNNQVEIMKMLSDENYIPEMLMDEDIGEIEVNEPVKKEKRTKQRKDE